MAFYKMALLIDGENISPSVAAFVLQEASKFGKVAIRRVYGDWTTKAMGRWTTVAKRFALAPQHILPAVEGKNSADIALVIDAMDILHCQPQIDGYCLVSSDSDFTGLAHRLREKGAFVMGIGMNHTSLAFVRACDSFSYINRYPEETFRQPMQPISTTEEPPTKTEDGSPTEDKDPNLFRAETPTLEGLKIQGKIELPSDKRFYKTDEQAFDPQLLANAFDQVVDKSTGLALCSRIGEVLKKKYSITPQRYGFTSLKQFLKQYADTSIYKMVVHNDGLTYSLKKIA